MLLAILTACLVREEALPNAVQKAADFVEKQWHILIL